MSVSLAVYLFFKSVRGSSSIDFSSSSGNSCDVSSIYMFLQVYASLKASHLLKQGYLAQIQLSLYHLSDVVI